MRLQTRNSPITGRVVNLSTFLAAKAIQVRRTLLRGASGIFLLAFSMLYHNAALAQQLRLEPSSWHLFSLPGDSNLSMGELFADSFDGGDLNNLLRMFVYDAQAQVYRTLGISDSLQAGQAFWILQTDNTPVSVQVPPRAEPAASTSAACASSAGCRSISLPSGEGVKWSLFGSPFNSDIAFNDLRLQTSSGVCSNGCTLAEAEQQGITSGVIYTYDTAAGRYRDVSTGDVIVPGEAYWIPSRLTDQLGQSRLLLPLGASDGDPSQAAENLALIKSNATRNTQYDDNPFYNVPADNISLSDLTVNYDAYNEALLDTSNSGFFRVKCETSHFAYDDPIVFPNQPGRAHLHMFFGNTDANAFSTFDSLLNTGTGTCNGEDLNRTAYWVPAMLDSAGNALIPDQIMVYYKNDLFRLNGANELVEPFPDNLRMVVGNGGAQSPQTDFTGEQQAQPIVSFSCGPAYGSNDRRQALIPDCYGNDQLEMQIAFPQCVNESAGYRPDQNHTSYSEGGYYGVRCPDSHSTDISSIMYRIFFSPNSYGGALTDLHLSSDVKMDSILPGGTTAHADWFGAWHPDAMRMWVDNCNNTQADCETGLLDRSPPISLVPRKRNFYSAGYRAPATELIKLCPGKTFNAAEPLRSVAMCRMN